MSTIRAIKVNSRERGAWTRASIARDRERQAYVDQCAAEGVRVEWDGHLLVCRTHTRCNCCNDYNWPGWRDDPAPDREPMGTDEGWF